MLYLSPHEDTEPQEVKTTYYWITLLHQASGTVSAHISVNNFHTEVKEKYKC